MAEILTESFCERCGTRYTFESASRRSTPLGALGTVGRGLRNFVVTPTQSLDEAFAVARAESEQRTTAHQLEAFHQTFNFCLSCRQYTCAECWNAVEGRCLSCAPLPEADLSIDAVMAGDTMVIGDPVGEAHPFAAGPADLAWPAPDVRATVPVDVVGAPRIVDRDADWADAVAAAPHVPKDEVEQGPEPHVEPEPELVAGEPEPRVEPVPEPMAADVGPEPVAGQAEVEPTAREPEPDVLPPLPAPTEAAPLSPFPPGKSLDEEIAAYDLRIAALGTAPPPQPQVPPPYLAVGRTEAAVGSSGQFATAAPASAVTPAVRGTVPEFPELPADPLSLVNTGTCPSCGLSLSASARFCRRCGMQQRV
jgi:hypothetical protein